jgi:hypothetical protein
MMEQRFGELRSLLAQPPSATGWRQLCAVVGQMADEDEARFAGEVLPYAQDTLRSWPDALRVPTPAWLDAAAASGDHACLPLVRELNTSASHKLDDAAARRLAHAPGLANVSALYMGKLPSIKIAMLRNAPMTRALRTLDLDNVKLASASSRALEQMDALREVAARNRNGQVIIDALERWGRLSMLERLSLSSAQLTHLIALTRCGALRELALWSNRSIQDAGVKMLCGPGPLRDAPLELLNLGGGGLTHASVEQLAQMPWRLKRLLLWDNSLTAESIALLAKAPAFAALTQLNISGMRLPDGAFTPLFAAPQRALEELWLSRSHGLSARSWAASAGLVRGLKTLHAESLAPDEDTFAAMMAGLAGGQIAELNLSANRLTSAQMQVMADTPLPALRILTLSNNPLREQGLELVLSAPWAAQLDVLKVSHCTLDAPSIAIIKRHAPRLQALRSLHIEIALPPGPDLAEQLRDALPGVTIHA